MMIRWKGGQEKWMTLGKMAIKREAKREEEEKKKVKGEGREDFEKVYLSRQRKSTR